MTDADTIENATPAPRKWSRWAVPAGLLGTGALVGGILASTLNAGAAPSPSPTPPAGPGYAAPYGGPPLGDGGMHGPRGGPHALDHTGTVSSVAGSTVTIKESAGTTTYQVDANSDIDKNGEAKLADLKAGDAVRFSVVTVSGKKTIGILHAGNEALNRPNHGPGGRPHDGPNEPGPAPSGSTTNSSASYST